MAASKTDKTEFVHLHNHSHYSLLDGANPIDSMLDAAHKAGMKAIALTDHGNLYGAVEFYQEAVSRGIKPILGCEVYVAPGKRTDRDSQGIREASHHLTLLARNTAGYRNLVELVTSAHLEGFYYKPRIDKEILAKHAEGLIGLSGCLKSEVNHHLQKESFDEAAKAASQMQQILGKGNYFIEVMDHQMEQQRRLRKSWAELSKKSGIPLVATNDCHYLKREDAKAHDVLLCIGTGRVRGDADRLKYATPEFYLKTPQEMAELFSEIPEAILATKEIAERCGVEFDFATKHLPKFSPPGKATPKEYLRKLCEEGLKRRYGETPAAAVRERLEYELRVIGDMGFIDYFLIVWDFIHYAKNQGIPVGPGRGSAAGSIVAYSLGITDIDPLKYNLLFERFLNPGRVTLPDIDVDFCQRRRDEVIVYVRNKYGQDSVAQIITFGTMAARAALRDVGRVLEIPLAEIDVIAKKVPREKDMTLEKALTTEPELKELYDKDERIRELFDVSKRLEGLCRHASTHAAGVVIGDKPLTHYLPLYKNADTITTQHAMEAVEALGLLKMDFLGLVTLTVLDLSVKMIKLRHGIDLNLNGLPLDDRETYQLLGRGECLGVFQLESDLMREFLQRFKPDTFEDIITTIAFNRPGPLQSGMGEDLIKRKHGQAEMAYLHPTLEPALKETYGVILYQEQVMQIAHDVAGFSLPEADELRRAMAKKKPELMQKFKERFLKGAHANGLPEKTAGQIFDLIDYFSGYGFNKSHSAAYALLTYQTAYLKARYPAEFMAAILSCEIGNIDKVGFYLEECRRMGIRVDPPDVNESFLEFTVVGDKRIRFGMAAVKGVGEKAVESIVAAREKHGRFQGLIQFCERVDQRLANKQVIEHLVQCGAFDTLGGKRAQYSVIVERAMELGSQAYADRQRGQSTMFGSFEESGGGVTAADPLPDVEEWPENKLLAFEKQTLGFYVTSHPLAKFARVLEQFSSAQVSKLGALPERARVAVGGMITRIKQTFTKKGQNQGERMAQFALEDLTGTVSCVIFPTEYAKYRELLVQDEPVFLLATLDLRREEPSLKADKIIPIHSAFEEMTAALRVRLNPATLSEDALLRLRDLLREHPGDRQVHLEFPDHHHVTHELRVGDDFFISPTFELIQKLEGIAGHGHVILVPKAVPAAPERPKRFFQKS